MTSSAISIRNLRKKYGDTVALKGIDIDISSAKIRGKFATKGDLSGLIPNSIELYVLQKDLYGQ